MLNITFPLILKEILETGTLVSPRGLLCKEKLSFNFIIDNPYVLACDFEDRNFPWKYLAAEMIWYLSGDLHSYSISQYAKLWGNISDTDNQVSSNYGHIVLHKKLGTGKTQYTTVLETLKKDKDTRQALIRYNSHEHAYEGNKDFPCTISNQFFIRHNKLHVIVNMRSNDMFFGFQYDVVWFGLLLQSLALDLNVDPGFIYWHTGSAHIYENMFEKASNIIKNPKGVQYSLFLEKSFIELRNEISNHSGYYWDRLKEYKGEEKKFITEYLGIEIYGT